MAPRVRPARRAIAPGEVAAWPRSRSSASAASPSRARAVPRSSRSRPSRRRCSGLMVDKTTYGPVCSTYSTVCSSVVGGSEVNDDGSTRQGWLAAGGAVFIALDAAALFLPGAPPKARDSAGEISAALLAHRSQLLAATYAAGLAVIAYLAFVAALRRFLSREGDDREMAATAFIAG